MTMGTRRISAFLLTLVSLAGAQLACVQDCMGSTFSVSGQVIDAEGQPIPGAEVRAYGGPSYEKPGFDIRAVADESGRFETESVFRYGCSTFTVEVTHGESHATYEYYPPNSDGNDPALPDELTVTLR